MPGATAADAQGLAEARGLSNAFRDAAKSALPAIVSIETRGKTVMANGQDGNPEDMLEGSPLGELFKRDPGMREFFRRGPQQRRMPSQGMGSGFIIESNGLILTNAHVVEGATTIYVTLTDKREFKAKLLGMDKRTDVAVVKIEARDLPKLPLGTEITGGSSCCHCCKA